MRKKLATLIVILSFATIFGSTATIANEINDDKINTVIEGTNEQTESLELQDIIVEPQVSHFSGTHWMGTFDPFDGNQILHYSLRTDPRGPFRFTGTITILHNGLSKKTYKVSDTSLDGKTITDIVNLPSMSGSGWRAELTGYGYKLGSTLPFFIISDGEFNAHIQ